MEQFVKNGRAIVFVNIEIKTVRGNRVIQRFPIEFQIVPMQNMEVFYQQRSDFIESRLMGKS